ncbi:serine/threonine-protein phosphatase 4 regulatory subunit 2 [Hyposmocoma kahamanoa]|uniref:serine/threonine-protein phosphatase 4 regulatory subunit 2 n=1 Tax=Hyposmocoma kahamanoa TaxID=1477025 RepID=UPI000E6D719C|nr:serine/threonine-protein phosphatase 4 regulatory subunit 2 [Hyposmocoma kahamanoa]
MENAEEIYHFLEDFSKRKPKVIPQELNDYLAYVARTGDPVYQWSLVKSLFKEKLLNVITDFHETTPGIEIPPYPNVDPFNYDTMKNSLLERLDTFTSAPFTVQRICELLTFPRKQYNRIDKFMRAIEKNILVVSTREPGVQRQPEPENGEAGEPIVNGTDNNSEYNVDVEMEDMSWKEIAEQQQKNAEPQPSSSDTHISVDDLETRLQSKQDVPMDTQEKTTTPYESVTPPELNVTDELETKPIDPIPDIVNVTDPLLQVTEKTETMAADTTQPPPESKEDVEMKTEEPAKEPLVIPEIKVDDAEMTEQRLNEESKQVDKLQEAENISEPKVSNTEVKITEDVQQANIDDSSSDSVIKEEAEPKVISEVSTSSEESSSSSENTDGNSNSPKVDSDAHIDVQEESSSDTNQSETNVLSEDKSSESSQDVPEQVVEDSVPETPEIQSDNYSISDVKSELQVPVTETPVAAPELEPEVKPVVIQEAEKKEEEKAEPIEINTENNLK